MPNSFPYPKAPIIEAVIEIRFDSNIPPDTLRKLNQQFAKHYPHAQEMAGFGVEVNVSASGPEAHIADQQRFFRRVGDDNQSLASLSPGAFVVSHLAPYKDWSTFFSRFKRDWLLWKRTAKHRAISRIGLRSVNRIDIPCTTATINQYEYLQAYVQASDVLGPALSYAAQLLFPYADGKGNVLINTAPVLPPPLLNHFSFMLDIDVSRQIEVPQRDDDIFLCLADMRNEKNRVFEACITDKARELFQ